MNTINYLNQEDYVLCIIVKNTENLLVEKGIWKSIEKIKNLKYYIFTWEKDYNFFLEFFPDENVYDIPNYISIEERKEVALETAISNQKEFIILLEEDYFIENIENNLWSNINHILMVEDEVQDSFFIVDKKVYKDFKEIVNRNLVFYKNKLLG